MDFLKELPVLVLGLGASGLAMARWCVRQGAAVTVWDSRDEAPQDAALAAELPQVRRIGGAALPALGAEQLAGLRLVLKSPGLAPGDERIAPLLQEARATGIALLGELDLFARALTDLRARSDYAPRVLAVTGTNGKTTVTALTALLVARTGRRVASAGNIGPTLLDTLAAALDAAAAGTPLPEVWVLELSSFQLDGGGFGLNAGSGFEPDAGVLLNLTQDHLDWHGSMAAYGAAKARVWGVAASGAQPRTRIVANRDDAQVRALVAASQPQPEAERPDRPGRKPARPRAVAQRPVLSFGLDAPQAPGDYGLVVENGMAWLVRAWPLDETDKPARGRGDSAGTAAEGLHLQRLMPADALRIRGRHNAANALAALALAGSIGCPLAAMLHGLREYAGEPHRLQFVASLGGVEAYDDSKGTNVGATVAALHGLAADKAPARLVVILGGDGKGQDFSPLGPPLRQHARAVATLGRDAAAIEAAVADAVPGLPLQRHATLPAAVTWCFEQAQPGDAVLLSPACASLDMFDHYAHRAQVFTDAVHALAAERGLA
jgi:UDP-N-acetylmuramoylalanine--D-glutamate ligase